MKKLTPKNTPILKKYYLRHGSSLVKRKTPLDDGFFSKILKPFEYVVGSKDSGSGVPLNVKLSLDPGFKKTVLTTAGIISTGIVVAVAVSKIK